MSVNVAEAIYKRHFEPCFKMLTEVINICPDELWDKDDKGHPIWQNVYHALAGSWVWFRPAGQPFQEPPLGEGVAELKVRPLQAQSKQEVLDFAAETKSRADAFCAMAMEGENLTAPFSFYDKVTNLDIIMMQIRHIQHHVGYCNKLLGKHKIAVPWQEARR